MAGANMTGALVASNVAETALLENPFAASAIMFAVAGATIIISERFARATWSILSSD